MVLDLSSKLAARFVFCVSSQDGFFFVVVLTFAAVF